MQEQVHEGMPQDPFADHEALHKQVTQIQVEQLKASAHFTEAKAGYWDALASSVRTVAAFGLVTGLAFAIEGLIHLAG